LSELDSGESDARSKQNPASSLIQRLEVMANQLRMTKRAD